MMASLPYFKLYVSDYLADTRHLTLEEHGAYLILLMLAWNTPDCRLPNDERLLARMLGINLRRWRRLWLVLAPFFQTEGEKLGHKRVEKERKLAECVSARQASNARSKGRKNKETRSAMAQPRHSHGTAILESRVQSPPLTPPKGGAALVVDLGNRLCELAGMRDYTGDYSVVQLWLNRGYSPALIEEAIKGVAARDGYTPPSYLTYFRKAVQEHAERHGARDPRLNDDPETVRWRALVRIWKYGSPNGKHPPGLWDSEGKGPPPDDPATKVPPAILAEHGIIHAAGGTH